MNNFSPILSAQPISRVAGNNNYRNSAREDLAHGEPVYFVPPHFTLDQYGNGGPRYKYGYTYNNCPYPESSINGNCTWWCYARLLETMDIALEDYMEPLDWQAKQWYRTFQGDKDPNADNIQAGDIIVLEDSSDGHVMFVEQVDGNTIHISNSAYSTRAIWNGYACHVTEYDRSEIVAGNRIDMYKGYDSAYYLSVVGVIHTGGQGPEPPTFKTWLYTAMYSKMNRRKKTKYEIIQ